jgi:site-specific DNA-methyltransferase (cytosine-N4-specific)
LVIDIGGAWNPGVPTRSLYHFKLLVSLVEDVGFHLAQEFYWWNPSKLPTPAEWVTVRRVRVKDAVNCVWWLSKTAWPKASNRRVLQPYSDSMKGLLKNGYRAKRRPSGHDIGPHFRRDHGAAIPPNLIAVANTDSNGQYLRYCREHDIDPHPARFPAEVPEFFVRMLTDPGDLVVDPFAGSCVTGEVCERLQRRWVCIELEESYVEGALGRFQTPVTLEAAQLIDVDAAEVQAAESAYYRIPRPGVLWNGVNGPPLPPDGGRRRAKRPANEPGSRDA